MCSSAFESVRIHRRLAACLALLGVAVFASGCGGDGRSTPKGPQATISGSVTNNGKPITRESNVVFYCPEASATAAGKIDALGKFNLKAADSAIGLPAGRYQVMVRPPEEPPAQVGTDAYQKMMMSGGTTTKVEKASDIPTKFQAFDTSELVLEVKAGENNFDLDLAKLGS
jgi:hypothetical protein